MSDSTHSTSEADRRPPRQLWPWVITSIVALVAALFLTVWVPQEQGEDLLQRIEDAGGSYTLDTSDRPEVGSFLEDVECVELFDRVDHLTLSGSGLYRPDEFNHPLIPVGNDLDDRTIGVLMTFSKLKRLRIYQRNYSNAAILKLVDHPSLRRLDVDGKVSSVLIDRFRKKLQEQGKIYPEIR